VIAENQKYKFMEQNKEEQKKLLTEIMEADTKDELYKQQSAVQWLETNFPKIGKSIDTATSLEIHVKFQQAKRMHEQQIKDAYEKGETNGIKSTNNANYTSLKTSEQYYNETFKK